MTDPELQAAMRGTLGREPSRLLHRLPFGLPAPVPHRECQPAAWNKRRCRLRLCELRVYPRPGLSPLQRGLSFRQAGVRRCREARLHRLPSKDLRIDGSGGLLDAADHHGDRFHAGVLSRRDRDWGSYLRLLLHVPVGHVPSPARRSARRGLARVGEEPGLCPESQVPRRRGHYREPATLHRDHAGPDRDLLHLQRRSSSTKRRSRRN